MKTLITLLIVLFVTACSSTREVTSDNATTDFAKTFNSKLGTANKADLVSEFGGLEWCRQENAPGETCRFHFKKGKRWAGKDRFKKAVEQYEEITAQFDENGILRSFKSKYQR